MIISVSIFTIGMGAAIPESLSNLFIVLLSFDMLAAYASSWRISVKRPVSAAAAAIAGDIKTAIKQAQDFAGHLIPIEVEVDTLEQLEQALDAGVTLVLLDNMTPEILSQAVAMCNGRAKTEASGGITPETVQAVAETGVDFIAMGYLTHSTTALDIGLDFSA